MSQNRGRGGRERVLQVAPITRSSSSCRSHFLLAYHVFSLGKRAYHVFSLVGRALARWPPRRDTRYVPSRFVLSFLEEGKGWGPGLCRGAFGPSKLSLSFLFNPSRTSSVVSGEYPSSLDSLQFSLLHEEVDFLARMQQNYYSLRLASFTC